MNKQINYFLLYNISQIASAIKAKTFSGNADTDIDHILLDSRKLLFPAASVFFALSGPRRNGNLFIAELYHKGVCYFVVDENFTEAAMQQYPKATEAPHTRDG